MTEHGSSLKQLTLARLRSYFRQPGVVFWSVGFPLLLSLALAIAFRTRAPDPVDVAVEQGPSAATWIRALRADPELRVLQLAPSDARAALRSGRVALVVEGESGTPIYRLDPMRPEARVARALVDDALQRAMGRNDVFVARQRRVTEPGSRYIDFLVPGLIGLNLLNSGLWGVGFVIVEQRTRKLLKRLLATPMRRSEFLLSFLLARLFFLAFELPLLLGFAWLALGVGTAASLPVAAVVGAYGSLSSAGLGLLLAARAQSTQAVSGLINLASFPMMLCSGVFFSASRFPDAAQPVIRALPLTALNDALRAVLIDRAGLLTIAPQLLVLTVWGVVCFVLALRLFRWQ